MDFNCENGILTYDYDEALWELGSLRLGEFGSMVQTNSINFHNFCLGRKFFSLSFYREFIRLVKHKISKDLLYVVHAINIIFAMPSLVRCHRNRSNCSNTLRQSDLSDILHGSQ